jgi:hypothetical protein
MGRPTDRFLAYAQDFEQTYDDDDWTRLERHFAPDAVYEVRNTAFGCRLEGVRPILAGLKKSLDGFDRRLDKRTIALTDGPSETADSVSFGWTATYTKPGAPPFVLRGRSTARLRGDVIVALVDEYPDGMDADAATWLAAHAPGLSAAYV